MSTAQFPGAIEVFPGFKATVIETYTYKDGTIVDVEIQNDEQGFRHRICIGDSIGHSAGYAFHSQLQYKGFWYIYGVPDYWGEPMGGLTRLDPGARI